MICHPELPTTADNLDCRLDEDAMGHKSIKAFILKISDFLLGCFKLDVEYDGASRQDVKFYEWNLLFLM